jgi:dihydroorotate dehydrogenase electron transfer subunit
MTAQFTATVQERWPLGGALEITLFVPELVRSLRPGSAVLVRAGPGLSPYLRRTFYPTAIEAETWTFRIPSSPDWGHAWLRTLTAGAEVDCLGPVGNGWQLSRGVRNVLCLGVGEHAWSLLPLITSADAAGLAVTFVAGASATRDSVPANRLPPGVEYHLVTADGRPDVTPSLMSTLSDLLPWADTLVAAGQNTLYRPLAATIEAARYGPLGGFAQVLYQADLLCGVGACQACAADVAGGRRRVCLRGPVFDLVDVVHRDG